MRETKDEYTPKTDSFKDKNSKQIKLQDNEEFAATHLQNETWKKKEREEPARGNFKLYKTKPKFETHPPTLEEIKDT